MAFKKSSAAAILGVAVTGAVAVSKLRTTDRSVKDEVQEPGDVNLLSIARDTD